ncbi:MAG: hypothetical protein R8J94_14900 [Acidimicrobiia bacterium]|nr:hypothetical protein [Acidimicrobiia bacterium]
MLTALGLLLGVLAFLSKAPNDPIDPAVRPTVDRLEQTPAPKRWSFRYVPISASPYVACLGGVDEVDGAVDTIAGLMVLEPNREAPPIIVTDSSFMIPSDPPELENWDEVQLPDGEVRTTLTPILGEVLAGFVADGVRLPDPKMTALAAVEIAESVKPSESLPGLTGDSFTVIVDADQFIAELEAGGLIPTEDDLTRIPAITVSVDDGGRVAQLIIRTPETGNEDHSDRGYVLTTEYGDVTPPQPPSPAQRQPVQLNDLNYPSPNESCAFGR